MFETAMNSPESQNGTVGVRVVRKTAAATPKANRPTAKVTRRRVHTISTISLLGPGFGPAHREPQQEDESAEQTDRHRDEVGRELKRERLGPAHTDQAEQHHPRSFAHPDAVQSDRERDYHREQRHEKE